MWVILKNAAGEEVHRYLEESVDFEGELSTGECVLVYNGRHFIYDDGGYADDLGDHVIFKEVPLRAVITSIVVT